MKRFLIGQYGGFDEEKYAHDFRDHFFGIEACMFDNETSIARLIEEKTVKGFEVGIHYPFFNKHTPLRDASFMALDPEVREQAYQEIEAELEALAPFKPHYVLFHYPKPVILDPR
ncbi:MAG TPA: sugar phosphate isomerase/epimerase, partial [Sporolactobacillaceae bacterium]|nr:sugar phosphate isomerase/epimerase [Sporolactobacillaceae bacterium]